jgi:hypothetical protein
MTISVNVDPNHKAVLNGLIKANKWMFTQISKTIPQGLISLSELSSGTDGAQIFADHNVRISTSKDAHEDLTLTTSIDLERNRLLVSLYRQKDLEDFDLVHMPELTAIVNNAFIKAGIIAH